MSNRIKTSHLSPVTRGLSSWLLIFTGIASLLLSPLSAGLCLGGQSELEGLVIEALKNSPELSASRAKAEASKHRIPQASSLPDPMFMVGYENMGTSSYTYGDKDSKWMFTASQMFPFPGKLGLKEEMAERESESLFFESEMSGINLILKTRILYSDLLFSHKELEITRTKKDLLRKIEETSIARYSSGMGMQQEALMAQTEKYMAMESEEMTLARIESQEAMLAAAIGRKDKDEIRIKSEPEMTPFNVRVEEAVKKALDEYPEIKARSKMADASKARLSMAEKEYYPDFTLSAGYALKGGDNEDMVNFSATANVPLFFRTKQREGVFEAKKSLEESRHETEAARIMIAASIRENFAMAKSSENLANLYKNAMIPKNRQDFQQSLAAYSSGKTEASMVLEKLKKLMDSEIALWKNIAEREKAIARIEALSAIAVPEKYLGAR